MAIAGIQIPAWAGAVVFAVTAGRKNAERLRELGADVVIDRQEGSLGELLKEATGKRRVDLVLDSVGEVRWGI